MKNASNYESLLNESVRIRGHLCAGQVLGVRISMLGLREIGVLSEIVTFSQL